MTTPPLVPPLAVAVGRAERAADAARGGADAVVAYHSSVYRDRGIPSVAGLLPWDSANRQTLQILPDVVRGVRTTRAHVPVVATICANDELMPLDAMLRRVRDAGANAVLNAPTVGLLTGPVREAIEAAGLGLSREMDLITRAHALGLQAWSYVHSLQWVDAAAEAGADQYIIHLGLTTHRSDAAIDLGAAIDQAGRCVERINALAGDAVIYMHGGPLTTPRAFLNVLAALDFDRPIGFFGASAFEQSGQDFSETLHGWRNSLSEFAENADNYRPLAPIEPR